MSDLEYQDTPADPSSYLPPRRPTTLDDIQPWLAIRSYNCLKREGLTTIDQLTAQSEESLLEIRSFGQRGVDDLKNALARCGMSIRATVMPTWGDAVVEEHVTVYRSRGLEVTVYGGGGLFISHQNLTAEQTAALCDIAQRIRAREGIRAREDPDTSVSDDNPTEKT
jgi:hypothetical protein